MIVSRLPEPRVSVVVRTHNEADRLRLTLASLRAQSERCEIVVVNDGSTDGTAVVLAEAEQGGPLTVVTHDVPRGRSAASNAGAAAANGEIVLFLDGDTLAGPDVVAAHAAVHNRPGIIGRGETWNLRCTRLLRDPETAAAQPGCEAQVAAMSPAECEALKVTLHQVAHDFGSIARRGQPGVYPGFGPHRLYELEMDALRHHPACDVLWAAASGSNLSAERARVLEVDGFDERIDNNEHRELALRLCRRGGQMVPVGARTYHMTHRSGWRDPLRSTAWSDRFRAQHPEVRLDLLCAFWAGLNDAGQATIRSLPDLAAAITAGTAPSRAEKADPA